MQTLTLGRNESNFELVITAVERRRMFGHEFADLRPESRCTKMETQATEAVDPLKTKLFTQVSLHGITRLV